MHIYLEKLLKLLTLKIYKMKLHEIYEKYQKPEHHGDKGTTHSYIGEYERLLKGYKNNSTVLEIGLYDGLSLQMWAEYFVNSKVIGIDINLSPSLSKLVENYNIIIDDATNERILDSIKDEMFDVIIDDGSHKLIDQLNSFELLKSKMNKGGIYIIEDVDNLDTTLSIYESVHDNIEVVDNRHIKNRFDDVLIVYRF